MKLFDRTRGGGIGGESEGFVFGAAGPSMAAAEHVSQNGQGMDGIPYQHEEIDGQ